MRRVSILLAVLGLTASLIAPSGAAASSRPVEYLALGDSLAFGYSPWLVPPQAPPPVVDADAFVGYPEIAADLLRDHLTNASCPGETSSHFIDVTKSDNGCGTWRFIYGFKLHAAYGGSQLAFADEFLQTHPKTQLVTLDIGANDLHVLVNSCGGEGNVTCILGGLPAMLATLSSNLDTIYGHIRTVDGYHHKLVALTIPARDYISDPLTTAVILQIDQVVTDRTLAWGGIVADGFSAEAIAAAPYGGDTCAAGLRLSSPTPPPTCDDHPSPAGRDLLARTLVDALRPD
jgi:hypothetical protein